MVHIIYHYYATPAYQSVGGYCKEYTKGKRPIGIMLEDTWLLRSVLLLTSRLLLLIDCLSLN